MRIHSIHIENYRQYKGPIDINFSLNDDKNFTVIEGTNGAGKTNLLNAITWCLYGKELHKSNKSNSGDEIYNSITKNETPPGGSFEVLVSLKLIDDYGIKTTFTRSVKYSRDKNGKITNSPIANLIVKNDLMGDECIERPNLFINKEFPREIEGYFFFDGEKLEDYFDDNSGNAIKNSVYQLVQLDLIDSALDHLENVEKYYNRNISKIDKKLGEELTNRSNLEVKLRKYKREKDDANQSIDDLNRKLEELRSELKEIDFSNIKELENELDRLKNTKKVVSKNIDKDNKSMKKLVLEKAPFVFAYSLMKDAKNLCKNTKNDDVAQSLYSKDLLEHILKENKCICGCDLSEDDHAHEVISDLIDKAHVSQFLSSEIKNLARNLEISLMEIEDVNDEIKRYSENIQSNESLLYETTESIEDTKMKISRIDHSAIRKLNAEINNVEKNRDKAISKRKEAEINYNHVKNELDKLEIDERNQKINNVAINKLQKARQFCEISKSNLEILKKNLIHEIRLKLEKETTDQFLKLMWKNNYEEVLISNNYDVRLKNVFDEIVPTVRLSAGEKLVLALSFVSAVNNLSGFNLPMIIDTPTGRLGTAMKNNVAEVLPKYMSDKQVTLLVTDEEYNDSFRDRILDKVEVEYKIVYSKSDNGEESRIVLNDR